MTTLKERFADVWTSKSIGGVQVIDADALLSFFQQELLALAEQLPDSATGIGAIPTTDEYAKGWNECRKQAFEARKAVIEEMAALIRSKADELN